MDHIIRGGCQLWTTLSEAGVGYGPPYQRWVSAMDHLIRGGVSYGPPYKNRVSAKDHLTRSRCMLWTTLSDAGVGYGPPYQRRV